MGMPGELLVGGDYERIDGTPRAPRAALGAVPLQASVAGGNSEQALRGRPVLPSEQRYCRQQLQLKTQSRHRRAPSAALGTAPW